MEIQNEQAEKMASRSQKKVVTFDKVLIDAVEKFAAETGCNFSEAIRVMVRDRLLLKRNAR